VVEWCEGRLIVFCLQVGACKSESWCWKLESWCSLQVGACKTEVATSLFESKHINHEHMESCLNNDVKPSNFEDSHGIVSMIGKFIVGRHSSKEELEKDSLIYSRSTIYTQKST